MDSCIFCKIINNEMPSSKVFEDDYLIAIKDIQPVAPVHFLLIPKKHIPSLNNAVNDDLNILGDIQLAAQKLAAKLGIAEQGYRLVNNCGDWGGQSVMHLHYHLIGGKPLGWPPE